MPCPERFQASLQKFDLSPALVDEINEGYPSLVSSSPKKQKAAYFKRAVDLLNGQLAPDRVHEILEDGACCKSGAREKASKEFARINADLPLEQRLEKIRKAPYLNMGYPVLESDGTITLHAVSYLLDGRYACACSNYRRLKRDYPVAKEYCFCCGGHFKYHYEIMLGRKVTITKVVSSPLDSNGAQPCVFSISLD